ncbi:xanthine dehydrogenase family protein molybdopterin-binding subunit [Mycolicibacterium elephantis]
MIGERVHRIEDPVLLRGIGRFAADITHAGELHMRVVRSPIAHGRIHSVQTNDALALEGVVAVWSYDDVAECSAIPFRLTAREELLPYRQPVLARGVVRYVGEPVAVVFADSAYRAEDAADTVGLDIESLPAHIDAELDPVPWLDSEHATWAAASDRVLPPQDSQATTFTIEYGDVDGAFESAAGDPRYRVFETTGQIGRHTGVPLECRGLVAWYDPSAQRLIVDGAAKVPFWNRDAVAAVTGLPPSSIILREGHVGGGFGPRGELYPEDLLVAIGAMRLGAPIKWIEDRQEHLVAANHSRGQRHSMRALVRVDDGWIEALDNSFILDQGAYVRTHGATVASLTASMLPGPYVITHFRSRAHVRLTHKTPAGTYRSPGRYEGTFARERLVDTVADGLGIDRADIRRRNFIPAQQMPYQRPIQAMGTDLVHDSGDYALLLDKAGDRFGFDRIRESVLARRTDGETVGFGLAFFVEKSGIGPTEGARVSVDASGKVTLSCGASSVGQGVDTVLAQVVADTLDISPDQVRVVRGQTDQFAFGRGAFATRLAVMAGSAAKIAADNLVEKAKRVAAQRFKTSTEELQVSRGYVRIAQNPDVAMSLAEVAARLEPVEALPLKEEPGLSADGWFHTDHMTYPYGVHAALVRLEPGTGAVQIERYFVAYDVGRALNPALVEGQIAGGVAQGIGGALYEEFVYTSEGTPLCTSFMDYLIPTIHEVPDIEILLTEDCPSPLNPLGVKGAGEAGTTAVAAALASAVEDALQRPGSITSVPLRPAVLQRQISASRQTGPVSEP